ncbi:VOC family protein [Flavobacterium rhizosphaerae]|uniref:VOC family protein n=1 Tax=Flavobacterium rhizosphaerae TaxID=3163298 RepID=A0ABW8YSJ1_9FLAO
MAKVTGFGGLFFRSKDNKALAQWYEKHLGINGMAWQQEAGPTVFAPFKQDTTYFGSPGQQFMMNFRVEGLEELLQQLKAAGVRIDEERMEESYGKFAWIYDPDGNKVELWEPTPERE